LEKINLFVFYAFLKTKGNSSILIAPGVPMESIILSFDFYHQMTWGT